MCHLITEILSLKSSPAKSQYFLVINSHKVYDIVNAIEGVEKVWTAENAAKELEQPLDREGDLAVVADKRTVIGGSEKEHDLSTLKGKRLRTHGSLHESRVPFILSEPLNEKYSNRAKENTLRSREIFEYALNGTVF